jgi:hypothetical protein
VDDIDAALGDGPGESPQRPGPVLDLDDELRTHGRHLLAARIDPDRDGWPVPIVVFRGRWRHHPARLRA